jgi:hypothetical protein
MEKSLPVYISPFTLMSWAKDELPAREDILSARQQRLSELESSGEIVIYIQDRQYSKDGIIKAFDNILQDTFMHYHLPVWKDRKLLEFLETGVYPADTGFSSQAIYSDAGFRQWLAPYCAAAFALALEQAIENDRAGDIARLLRKEIQPGAGYEAVAWEPVRKQMVKAASYLETLHTVRDEEQKKAVFESGSVSFLQLLTLKPAELFYDETFEYTRQLHNAACSIPTFDKYVIYHNLLNLDLDPELKEVCKKNYAGKAAVLVFASKHEGFPGTWAARTDSIKIHGDSQSDTVESWGCRMIFWILGMIFFVVVMSMVSKCVNSREHDRRVPKINIPEYKFR